MAKKRLKIKTSKRKADTWFSRYIRLRDSDQKGNCFCITCNKSLYWKKLHCGHFQSRRHLKTRYNEKNCSAQCAYCNTYMAGEQYKFAKSIDKKWGEGTAEKLIEIAHQPFKLKAYEYEELAEIYKTKAIELAKGKSIEV